MRRHDQHPGARRGTTDALADIQTIQKRANRKEISGAVDEQTLIDEWCREFYVEGRRRSDLIRFGLFSGSKYLWDFKGGVAGGIGIESKFNVYSYSLLPTLQVILT